VIEVVRAGALTTVQDLGRPGHAHLGVPRSGALDRPALCLANALVGNTEGSAGLETTLTGCAVRLPVGGTVAVTGATARVRVDGADADPCAALEVPPGGLLDVGRAAAGVRSYVAFAGGIVVEPVLGSRATDTLSGLGPPVLRDGDALPLGVAPSGVLSPPRMQSAPRPDGRRAVRLQVHLGPRADWFVDSAIEALLGSTYTLSPMSNRVGARLTGAGLARARAGELPSEGLVLGAIQVPADGQPLVFLADHPTTGGYPVIGVVDDVTPLAQARPGTTVTFHGPQR
jgi:biotin-dependent carboxylase-like uncharacterized protein